MRFFVQALQGAIEVVCDADLNMKLASAREMVTFGEMQEMYKRCEE